MADWLPSGPDFTLKGPVSALPGWLELVERRPKLDSRLWTPAKVAMTPQLALRLSQVQMTMNRKIKYVSDKKAVGRGDYWRVAETEGDCEDYALAKREKLREHGWPEGALLIAILMCWDFQKKGWIYHAVLAVMTEEHGPWILDNRLKFPRTAIRIPGYHWTHLEQPGEPQWQRISLARAGVV